MLEAALWALLAASALVVGAVANLFLPVPRRVVALALAFGAGALISALAFDLAAESFEGGGTGYFGVGVVAGALTYYSGNRLIGRYQRRRSEPASRRTIGPTAGPAIVLGALLDGVPESIVLGASLLGGSGVGVPFLAAVFLSNLPEGLAGTRDLSDEGHGRSWIIGLWVLVAVASSVAAGIGYLVLDGMSREPVALVQAFAAGAILTMLADTMMPEAYEHGGDVVGLATVLGFAAAFLLSTVS